MTKTSYTTSYSLMQWYDKWMVVKTTSDSVKKGYLRDVRNGATVWYFDPLYARGYSKKTALRHLRDLRASDPTCDEDF